MAYEIPFISAGFAATGTDRTLQIKKLQTTLAARHIETVMIQSGDEVNKPALLRIKTPHWPAIQELQRDLSGAAGATFAHQHQLLSLALPGKHVAPRPLTFQPPKWAATAPAA